MEAGLKSLPEGNKSKIYVAGLKKLHDQEDKGGLRVKARGGEKKREGEGEREKGGERTRSRDR